MTNFLTEIEKAEHTTAAWIANELQKFTKAEPKIENVVDTSVTYIGGALQIAADAAGQVGLGTEIGAVVATIHQDLTATNALVTDFGATPTAASAFGAIKNDLSNLLPIIGVKSPTATAAVTKAVNEVGTISTAIQNAAAAIAASAGTAAPAVG